MANQSLTTPKYGNLQKDVRTQLTQIGKKLKDHQARFNEKPENWGYIGDLAAVKDHLSVILSFLK